MDQLLKDIAGGSPDEADNEAESEHFEGSEGEAEDQDCLVRKPAGSEVLLKKPSVCAAVEIGIQKKPAGNMKRPAAAPARVAEHPAKKKKEPTPEADPDEDDSLGALRDKMKARKFDSLWDDLPEPLKQEYEKAYL